MVGRRVGRVQGYCIVTRVSKWKTKTKTKVRGRPTP